MNIIILLLVTIFSYLSFLYGRSRIKTITSSQSIKINALPNYYGYYLALWCAIPALVILLFWSIFEPAIIKLLISQTLIQNDLKATIRYIFHTLGFTFLKAETEQLSDEKLANYFVNYGIIFESIEQAMNEYIIIREQHRTNEEYEIADVMRDSLLKIGIKIEDGKKDGWSWNNN